MQYVIELTDRPFFEINNVIHKGILRALSNTYNGALSENSQRLTAVHYFCRKVPSGSFKCTSDLLNTPLIPLVQNCSENLRKISNTTIFISWQH